MKKIRVKSKPSVEAPAAAAATTALDEMLNRVTYGDCIVMMKRIPTGSVDMVCTDPPYFLDGLGSDWNKESLDSKGSSAVVGNLPKGMKFDRNQSKKVLKFAICLAGYTHSLR